MVARGFPSFGNPNMALLNGKKDGNMNDFEYDDSLFSVHVKAMCKNVGICFTLGHVTDDTART
jgi:hypothetical protein